jgi:hypothetical protein
MPHWRVHYVDVHLGDVEAPDERSAVLAAAKKFNIAPPRRMLIIVTRTEPKRGEK